MVYDYYSELDVAETVYQILNGTWENISLPLAGFQKEHLLTWQTSYLGLSCLLQNWFLVEPKLTPGSFCNATWDGHYCWPPTSAGTTIQRTCTQAFEERWPYYAPHLKGTAYRVCLANSSWLWKNWTNYTECADSYDAFVGKTPEKPPTISDEDAQLVTQVQNILFIGSILSLACLLTAIIIFCSFKSLWCDRVTIHIQLMAALSLRYVLLIIISEPFVLGRTTHYRSEDWICKAVLLVYLYATVTSVNWMFIQGVYLNSKLTTNVFDKEAPFKLYYTFGWIIPVPLIVAYGLVMHSNHTAYCWKGYGDLDEVWIILGPILFALVINLGLLLNILRILVTKVHTPGPSADAAKTFRRAAKATLILSPVLGINNLLFVYNPGGIYNRYYVLANTLCCSSQGVFVALIYCYMSREVHTAFHRWYRRLQARRDANRRMLRRRNSQSSSSGIIVEHPVYFYRNGNASRQAHSTRSLSTATIQSTGIGTIRENPIKALKNSAGNHINRLYPAYSFEVAKKQRKAFNAKNGQHVVFWSRRLDESKFESSTFVNTGLTEKAVERDDVIIPLSELVSSVG